MALLQAPVASSSAVPSIADGLSMYGEIRSSIGFYMSVVVGILMFTGGVVLIVLSLMGKMDASCTPCSMQDASTDICVGEGCVRAKASSPDIPDSDTAKCEDSECVSGKGHVWMGVGLIVVAIIVVIVSYIWRKLVYSNKSFAAVAGGVGIVSDVTAAIRGPGMMMMNSA